ncbi:hypothetical protein [Streptomyces sp. NPDC057426]|uniref:hypothetical protein n=1 Tax=Streptomyces sp. NPDC057426 TaxID=3346128 RepID=UPI00368FB499
MVHPVPPTTSSQALLEALILDRLGTPPDYCAHHLGIASVASTDTSLTMRLDPYIGGDVYPFPEHCLGRLLPSVPDPGTNNDLGGIAGLRVRGIDSRRRELHLELSNQCGGPGTVRLVLPSGTTDTWSEILRRVACCFEKQGFRPVWGEPGVTAAEKESLEAYPSLMRTMLQTASTGSGLLRRIALFHKVTDFYRVRCWQDGDSWKIDACAARSDPGSHDRLVQRLFHPRWGLPLTPAHRYCWCGEAYGPRQWGHTCSFYVDDKNGHHVLYLRVHTNADGPDLTERADTCRAAGAAPAWITRVFPPADETVRTMA